MAAQDEPHMCILLLIKPVTYQSGVAYLFLQSLPTLCLWEPVSDYTWSAPKELVNQQCLEELSQNQLNHTTVWKTTIYLQAFF